MDRRATRDIVLRSSGLIILDTGELRRTAQIESNGDAVFLEIPANMHVAGKASLGLDSEGFELAVPQGDLALSPATFYVEVRPKPGRLAGYVKGADGDPLSRRDRLCGKDSDDNRRSRLF